MREYYDLVYRDQGATNTGSEPRTPPPDYYPDGYSRVHAIGNALNQLVHSFIQVSAVKDALKLRNDTYDQLKQIADKHPLDPEAYTTEHDGQVRGIVQLLGDETYDKYLKQHVESDKNLGLLTIAQNNLAAQRAELRDEKRRARQEVASQIGLIANAGIGGDKTRPYMIDELRKNLDRALGTMDDYGRDHRLEQANNLLTSYNRDVERDLINTDITKCQTIDQIDAFINGLAGGKVAVPRFGVVQSESGNITSKYLGESPVIGEDNPNYDQYFAEAHRKRERIESSMVCDDQWIELSSDDRVIGTTRQSADRLVEQYRDELLTGPVPQCTETAQSIISKVDILPSIVPRSVDAALCGDRDAAKMAKVFIDAVLNEDPKLLAEEYRHDIKRLTQAIMLSQAIPITGLPDEAGYARMLDKLTNNPSLGNSINQELIERAVMDRASGTRIKNQLFKFEHRRVLGTAGWFAQQTDIQPVSEGFITQMQDVYREALLSSGGNSAVADTVLYTTLARYRGSEFCSGLSLYVPENYPKIAENRSKIFTDLRRRGERYVSELQKENILSAGAKYINTELVPYIGETDRDDDLLVESREKGLNYYTTPNGQKMYCPSYHEVIYYDDNGIITSDPVGLYNPSVIINQGSPNEQ